MVMMIDKKKKKRMLMRMEEEEGRDDGEKEKKEYKFSHVPAAVIRWIRASEKIENHDHNKVREKI